MWPVDYRIWSALFRSTRSTIFPIEHFPYHLRENRGNETTLPHSPGPVKCSTFRPGTIFVFFRNAPGGGADTRASTIYLPCPLITNGLMASLSGPTIYHCFRIIIIKLRNPPTPRFVVVPTRADIRSVVTRLTSRSVKRTRRTTRNSISPVLFGGLLLTPRRVGFRRTALFGPLLRISAARTFGRKKYITRVPDTR